MVFCVHYSFHLLTSIEMLKRGQKKILVRSEWCGNNFVWQVFPTLDARVSLDLFIRRSREGEAFDHRGGWTRWWALLYTMSWRITCHHQPTDGKEITARTSPVCLFFLHFFHVLLLFVIINLLVFFYFSNKLYTPNTTSRASNLPATAKCSKKKKHNSKTRPIKNSYS